MLIIPAIDLKKSKVVRLHKGKFEHVTSYGVNPEDVIKDFIINGAKRIHIVSLLGAKDGKILKEDIEVVKNLIKIRNLNPVERCTLQLGGGIRRNSEIKQLFDLGIDFLIIGTAIVIPQILETNFTISDIAKAYSLADKKFQVEIEMPEPDLADKLKTEIKNRIIVSIDVSRDSIALSGWQVTLPVEPSWIIKKLVDKNFSRFMITDTTNDGTLSGIDIKVFSHIITSVKKYTDKHLEFIIGGGIASDKDIELIVNSGLPIAGIVIGKALYEQKIHLSSVIRKYQICN